MIKCMMKFVRRQGYKYIPAKFDKERKVVNDMVTHNIEMDVENESFHSSQSMEAVCAVQKATHVQEKDRHTK
eukprot:4415355-Heterocapsa_arctica.AAC.1